MSFSIVCMRLIYCCCYAVTRPHARGVSSFAWMFFSLRSQYVNNAEVLREAEEVNTSLPEGLYEACLKTGRTPTSGEVKMVYYTKVNVRLDFPFDTARIYWNILYRNLGIIILEKFSQRMSTQTDSFRFQWINPLRASLHVISA